MEKESYDRENERQITVTKSRSATILEEDIDSLTMVKLFDELRFCLSRDDHTRIKAILNEKYKMRSITFPLLCSSSPPLPLVDAARLNRERSLRVMLEFLDEQITLISSTKKKRSFSLKVKAVVNMVDVEALSFYKGCAEFTPLMYAVENRNINSAELLLNWR